MDARRGLLLVLVGGFLALVVALLWPSSDPAPPSRIEPAALVDPATPPPALATGDSSRNGTVVTGGHAPLSATPTASEPPAAPVTIVGRVRLPEGRRAPPGVAWARGGTRESPNEEILLANAPISEDGTFELRLEYRGSPGGWGPEIVALLSGFGRMASNIDVKPGETVRVELTPGDRSLAAQVVDPAGHPVAGPRILLTTFPLNPAVLDAPETVVDDDVAVSVTTDRDGLFRVEGLKEWPYEPVSVDPSWMLAWKGLLASPPPTDATEVRVIQASPAFEISGVVFDATTGDPVRPQHLVIHAKGGPSHGVAGGSSTFAFRHAMSASTADLEFLVEVEANGYRPSSERVRIAADQRFPRLKVGLVPLRSEEVGVLLVKSGLRDESGKPLSLSVLRRVTRGRSTTATEPRLVREAAGTARVELPAGPSFLVVRSWGLLGDLMTWEGPVDAPGGRETPFEIPWPPHGSLRVELPEGAAAGAVRFSLARLDAPGGAYYDKSGGTKSYVHVPALPAGSWKIERFVPRPPYTLRATFRIERGETTTVAYPR
jgi:hypothetical protein